MIDSTQDVQEKVVLFVDLLGFASLTEEHPLQLDFIKDSDRFVTRMAMVLSGQENPLTQVFTGFHRALNSAINLAQHDHPLTAITFSDSAYIATNRLCEAVNIASYFVQTLVRQRIPVRAGIAYGTFSAVRFRSDVTLEGGAPRRAFSWHRGSPFTRSRNLWDQGS
jgi:class 3 adenylate cyclase